MLKIKILCEQDVFTNEFARCCREYKNLHIASAWCGDPRFVLPYSQLKLLCGKLKVTVGISLNFTHPDAIKYLRDIGADLRVFKDQAQRFHPKVYFFSKGSEVAVFIGSSNLTYFGFYNNLEVNILLEGKPSEKEKIQIDQLMSKLHKWHSDECSFVPDIDWLKDYKKAYKKSRKTQEKHRIKTPPLSEEDISTTSWLRYADWFTYYNKVLTNLKEKGRSVKGYSEVLESANKEISLPWKVYYFHDIEKRRIIGGIGKYGWLGHVGASGKFRRLLATGPKKDQDTIVSVINIVGAMNPPLKWDQLERQLKRLVNIGCTMNVWGRLLSLIRPDLYLTVASKYVRKNLSEALSQPKSIFEKPKGYVRLLEIIHASPWFNSKKPDNQEEFEIWSQRVAFMDAILH